jgi:hypothetical protein
VEGKVTVERVEIFDLMYPPSSPNDVFRPEQPHTLQVRKRVGVSDV